MATRQYIGARYVPKFYQNSVDGSAQWESNVVYEPLTFVTLTNSHMYISKKQVPATVGSPVSNIEYWLDVGSYNGFIEQLQDEIDTINEVTIPTIQGDIALKQDITDSNLITTAQTIVGAINEVATEAASLSTNKQDKNDNSLATTNKTVVGGINELNAEVNGAKRKAIYIGNSYASGTGSTTGTDGIYALTKDMFADSKLYADGGVGFLTYTSHSTTFEDLLDDAIADNYFDSLNEVTDIIILSAWGDTLAIKNRGVSQAGTDLQTALNSFMTKVKNNFTNIKRVSIAFVETRAKRIIPNTAEGNSLYNEPFDAYWLLKTLAPRTGFEFLGWVSWEAFMVGTGYTTSDYYHPNDAGYTVISANFKSAYYGAYVSSPRYSTRSIAFNITSGSTAQMYLMITPDESVIEIGRVNVVAGATPAQYTRLNLMDFSTYPDTSIVPPMPLGKTMNVNNIDVLPDADFTHVLTLLAAISANSEGSVRFDTTTFNATESLSARNNAHCLENMYHIVNAL